MRERSRGVLTHPADSDGLARLLTDGVRPGYPELPVRDVEHVIGRRFPLRLHGEDKDVSPDPGIYALFVEGRHQTPGRVRRPNTSSECRFWVQLCKKAEHFTSIAVPSGA